MAQFGGSLLLRAIVCVPVGATALALGSAAGYGETFAALFAPLFAATVADGVGTLAASVCQARGRVATSALIQVARNLLRGAALAVVALGGGGAVQLAVLFAFASVAGAVPAVVVACGGERLPLRFADVRPAVRTALPFGAAILATIVHGQADTLLLGAFAGDGDVGRYHASMRFVLLLQMVPQVVAAAAAPLAFRTGLAGIEPSARIYRLKMTALAPLGLLASLFLLGCGDTIVGLCLGERFRGAGSLLIALAPVVFVKFATSAMGGTLAAIDRQHRLALGTWAALALNVAIGCAVMPAWGAMGAVAATLVSETVLMVLLARELARAGMDLAFARVLRHPCAAAVAAGLAALLVAPRWAAIVAAIVAAALAFVRPTPEERLLLRAAAGGPS
jgi:O-antigen/teichoic acid export membrane protein